ncbi:hypothetical protein [Paenibacillus amylolyticus]|nr:hypothetical protein [Paenibacillus amylolyticus]
MFQLIMLPLMALAIQTPVLQLKQTLKMLIGSVQALMEHVLQLVGRL